MLKNRRAVLSGAGSALLVTSINSSRASAKTRLKISHQFPSSGGDSGDFRDQLVRKFAEEVEKQTSGDLAFDIYPGSSLMKTVAQFSALRKGALDLSLFPLAYAGGEVPECGIAQLPGVVTSYSQGLRWRDNPVGQSFQKILHSKGITILSWVWQAASCASRDTPVVDPVDSRGLKVRGASREMDLVLREAGSSTVSFPSNELYAAMQTGLCDAVISSSTSLISFRIAEVAKHLTAGRGRSYLFTFQPLVMSKSIFDGLPKNHQDVLTAVGRKLDNFGVSAALNDDKQIENFFRARNASLHSLTDIAIENWTSIAKRTAWKDYAAKNANCAELLKLAEQVA